MFNLGHQWIFGNWTGQILVLEVVRQGLGSPRGTERGFKGISTT
jgi:hypothetical protein